MHSESLVAERAVHSVSRARPTARASVLRVSVLARHTVSDTRLAWSSPGLRWHGTGRGVARRNLSETEYVQ